MHTQDFQTKTLFLERKNPGVDNAWGIALDIGYSGVKGFSSNKVYCFPAFARKCIGQPLALGEPGKKDIQYKDEHGTLWNVGYLAQNSISSDDSNDSLSSLYGRNRYFSPMFLVLARTGLAIGMMQNQFGNPIGKKLILQTGLPPAYLKTDSEYLKDVLAAEHSFSVKVGADAWRHFHFSLSRDNIHIMAQPMGSFLSAALDNNSKQVPDANRYFKSNVLIFDAGFGTVDIYDIKHRQVASSQSFDDLGMKAVLTRTSAEIYRKYGIDIPVHAMQKCLQDGYIKTFDRRAMTTKKEPFDDILQSCSKEVCNEAIERLKTMYNNLLDYDYLLVTGGTGAAWFTQISQHFAGMESLNIIGGNQNDTLSHIFSNVRGYYLFQNGILQKKAGE